MQRCFQLARLAAGHVAPNPMVGAVLVYDDIIIGEGYHQVYGQAHAEVNCINSVHDADKTLINKSTLYVSLEPCAHFGKTPPCADLIIKHQIPKVVIACRDSFTEVDGKGISKLKAAGVEVITFILEKEALDLNKRFFTFHNRYRPYIILKWAQTNDRKIAGKDGARVHISNELTNRKVHRWRSSEAAILVGFNTALKDDPSLTTRLWKGNNPIRLVIDKDLTLPTSLHLFDATVKTIVFNTIKHSSEGLLRFHQLLPGKDFIAQMLAALYRLNIQSVLVEGGAKLLQSFIDESCWDEARLITNTKLNIGEGVAAPSLLNAHQTASEKLLADTIDYYNNTLLPAIA